MKRAKKNIARYAKVVKNLPEQLLNEIYLSIKNAALWDLFPNLGITDSGHYYILDVEEPFDHKPQLFFYQGDAGYQKYLEDVRDGFHRVANGLKEIDAQQFERWKKICEQDHEFIVECTKHNTLPDYLKA